MTKRATARRKKVLVERFMRETILASAKQVLAAHTYGRTSLDRIADAAQMSKGSIYSYFRDKEDLLWEVLRACLQNFIESGKTAAAGVEDPVGKLRAILQAHLELFMKDPDTFKIALAERTQLILNPRGHRIQQLWKTYQEYAEWVGGLFELAAADGLMRPVPTRRTALRFLDMVLMEAYQRLASRPECTLQQDVDEIMSWWLDGLGSETRMRARRSRK